MIPLIHVYKNKFVNAKSDTILFRGVSIADPDKLEHQGHWNKHHFEKVKQMGIMLVRIPVHPIAWRERTPVKYLHMLDSAVNWCTDLGMYIILTGILLAIWRWSFSKTQCIILHKKKHTNSGRPFQAISPATTQLLFMNFLMSRRLIEDNLAISVGPTGKKLMKI